MTDALLDIDPGERCAQCDATEQTCASRGACCRLCTHQFGDEPHSPLSLAATRLGVAGSDPLTMLQEAQTAVDTARASLLRWAQDEIALLERRLADARRILGFTAPPAPPAKRKYVRTKPYEPAACRKCGRMCASLGGRGSHERRCTASTPEGSA